VKGQSDCGHFNLALRRACQDKVPGDLRIECACERSVGEAIWPRLLLDEACPSWASSESRVHPPPEEALRRGVNSSGTTVPARG
jgi:hypothetical protein